MPKMQIVFLKVQKMRKETFLCGKNDFHQFGKLPWRSFEVKFKWEILDTSENTVKNQPARGSELQIPSNLLTVTEQYMIRCTLVSSPQGTAIAMALQKILVLQRGIVLRLAVIALSVGPRQPFKLFAYFADADNIDSVANIQWACTSNSQGACTGFNSVNSTTFESNGFADIGRYNISVTATKGDAVKTNSCEIQVTENGLVKIEVDNVDEPIDPSKEIDIPVYVSALVTSCTLQWMSVQAANYEYIDLQTVPGNINIITNVTLKEDEFLNEIDEFSNSTVDMEYNLKIPPPKDKWKGLQGDTSYLFRLNVTCPVPSANNKDEDDDEEVVEPLQNYVTLTADVPLHTDALPRLNSLEVTPSEGAALKTLFYFQTNETISDDTGYPILYKFGYFLDKEVIFVSNLLGVPNSKSVLPYIEKGVKTVLEGCNSYSLCAQISGPTVVTEVPLKSDIDQNKLIGQLRDLINREEYYKAFSYSLAILQTYNKVDKDFLKSMSISITNLTVTEIKRLLDQSDNDETDWRIPANDLIRNIGPLLNKLPNSEELLNNIVALRNRLSNKKNFKLFVESIDPSKFRASRKLLMVDKPERVKRQSDKITLEEVRSYLVISELIITSSPDKNKVKQEKQNMLNQIDKFMQQLCTSLYERSQTISLELKTLILSVEKINRNNLNRYLHILYDTNTWKVNGRIKLGRCFTEKIASRQMCIGKVVLKNYLNKKGLIYMVKVYSTDANIESKLQDTICDFILVLPIDEKQIIGKEVKCALWRTHWLQSQCKTLQVTAKTIQCTCNYLGLYSLEYNDLSGPTILIPEEVTSTTEMSTLTDSLSTTTTARVDTTVFLKSDDTTTSLITIGDSVAFDLIDKHSTLEKEDTSKDDFTTTDVFSTNATIVTYYASAGENETILYFVIGFSVSGIAILLYGIRYLLSKGDDVPTNNFPRYALLHHEEMLQDLAGN